MTIAIDKLVSDDLHTLAAASRASTRTVDDTLRAIGALERGGSGASAARGHVAELEVVAASHIYVRRVTRIAIGGVLLAMAIGLWMMLVAPVGHNSVIDGDSVAWWANVRDPNLTGALEFTLVCVVVAAGLARALAESMFEHRLGDAVVAARDPRHVATQLVRAIDGWSFGLGLAGLVAFVVVFGVAALVGVWNGELVVDPSDLQPVVVFTDRLRDLAIAVPLVVLAAVAVTRGRFHRVLARRSVVSLATVALVALLIVSFVVEDGPSEALPSSAFRSLLTVLGGVSVFVIAAGVALQRRAREYERLGAGS